MLFFLLKIVKMPTIMSEKNTCSVELSMDFLEPRDQLG